MRDRHGRPCVPDGGQVQRDVRRVRHHHDEGPPPVHDAMPVEPEPCLRLDDQLCFALYAASRAVTARYRPMLDAIGLTYPQYLVMMLLWEADHQTVGQLGSRLALDSGTLSPLLKRLTAAGLVTRHRRVEDERSVSIALTDEGRDLREKAFAISEEMIGTIGFDTGEFDDLKIKLRLLTERVTTSS
jgi:MarR family transcriptional regulator, organic hydroperoxide resistance regulator